MFNNCILLNNVGFWVSCASKNCLLLFSYFRTYARCYSWRHCGCTYMHSQTFCVLCHSFKCLKRLVVLPPVAQMASWQSLQITADFHKIKAEPFLELIQPLQPCRTQFIEQHRWFMYGQCIVYCETSRIFLAVQWYIKFLIFVWIKLGTRLRKIN